MATALQNKLKSIAAKLACGGAVIIALGFAYLLLTPKSFQASARLKVEKSDPVHRETSPEAQNSNSQLASAECQVLRSNEFFDRVIQELGLAQSWAKRDHLHTPPTIEAVREHLYRITDIHPLPGSSLIDINVTSDDANETAKIANAFAHSYLDFRQAQRQNAIRENLDSIEKQWDAQNKKIQEAQEQLASIVFRIERDRATNNYIDGDSYGLLQAKRIQLEGQFVESRDELTRLKTLPPAELRQVLSSLDSQTNSLLNPLLLRLGKAKRDLTLAESAHGPDSAECKEAKLMVAVYEKKVGETVDAAMDAKQRDLAIRKATLDAFAEKLKHAKRFNGLLDTNMASDASYKNAFEHLEQLKKDGDTLQQKLNDNYLKAAIRPAVVTVELVDQADVPFAPATPNLRFATAIIGTGGAFVFAGIGLLVLSFKLKPRKT